MLIIYFINKLNRVPLELLYLIAAFQIRFWAQDKIWNCCCFLQYASVGLLRCHCSLSFIFLKIEEIFREVLICFCTYCIWHSNNIFVAKNSFLWWFLRQDILLILRCNKTFQSFIWMLLSIQLSLLVLQIINLKFIILILKSFTRINFLKHLIFIYLINFIHLIIFSKCLVFICFLNAFLILIGLKIYIIVSLLANNFGKLKFIGSCIFKWGLLQRIYFLNILFILRLHAFSEL